VLVVGQGLPTSGGIPTFVTRLVADPVLGAAFDIDYLNTTPTGDKRPGGLTPGNVRQLLSDVRGVLARGAGAYIVHLHLAPVPVLPLLRALLLAASARAAGARVILHAHTGRLPAALRSRFYRSLFRVVCGVVETLVVASREAEIAAGRVCNRVVRIENGIDVGELDGPVMQGTTPPVLSFVGTVCERKGLLELRDALVALGAEHGDRSLQVWIIGDARQEGPGVFERMQRAYADAGLGDVEFLGRLDRAEVLERLRRSEIFCLPSHWEAFPLSILEAMAAGTAVVASSVGDVSEMLADGEAGILVAPGDSGELSAALDSLVTDPDRRRRLARAARRRVHNRYSWGATIGAIDHLYRSIGAHSR
jgi:glycosyltransferase involved in cell wall biosynthesis